MLDGAGDDPPRRTHLTDANCLRSPHLTDANCLRSPHTGNSCSPASRPRRSLQSVPDLCKVHINIRTQEAWESNLPERHLIPKLQSFLRRGQLPRSRRDLISRRRKDRDPHPIRFESRRHRRSTRRTNPNFSSSSESRFKQWSTAPWNLSQVP
jgi:hypothetical protein